MNATPTAVDGLPYLVDEQAREALTHRLARSTHHRRGWLVRRMLLAADLLGLGSAFATTEVIFGTGTADRVGLAGECLAFSVTIPVWIVMAKLSGLYDRDEERLDYSTTDELVGVFHIITAGIWFTYLLSALTGITHFSVDKAGVLWLLSTMDVLFLRSLARLACRRHPSYLQNTLIIGVESDARLVAAKIVQHREYGINLLGVVDLSERRAGAELPQSDVPVLSCEPGHLSAVVRSLNVERVVVALSGPAEAYVPDVVEQLRDLEIQLDLLPPAYGEIGFRGAMHLIEGLTLIGIAPLRLSSSSVLLKRVFDIAASLTLLFFVLPLLFLIALLIRLDSPGPVLYRHERVGRGRRNFELLKFRTMMQEYCRGDRYAGTAADEAFLRLMGDPALRVEFGVNQKLQDDPRVTRVGRFLRRWSLDELPQLLNVLRGDISLVGPRPITEQELHRYGEGVARLLHVRPGITGLWQISGRSRLSYEDRVRLDLAYINHWSLRLDTFVIFRTVRAILRSGDAY